MAIHKHHSRSRAATVSHSSAFEQHLLSATVIAIAVVAVLLTIAV